MFVGNNRRLQRTNRCTTTRPFYNRIAGRALSRIRPQHQNQHRIRIGTQILNRPILRRQILIHNMIINSRIRHFILKYLTISLLRRLRPLRVNITLLTLTSSLTVRRIRHHGRYNHTITLMIIHRHLHAPLLRKRSQLHTVRHLRLTLLITTRRRNVLEQKRMRTRSIFRLLNGLKIAQSLRTIRRVQLRPIHVPVTRRNTNTSTRRHTRLTYTPIHSHFKTTLNYRLRRLNRIRLCQQHTT